MNKDLTAKFVCIHGHFYQPPRNNPWLEAIEREHSASPYHDWNERINLECYRANAAARITDEHNKILELHNNYESMSFNFGPTLLQWLQTHDPWTHAAIIDADRKSCERFRGHGNALAQVYTHIIMPLATRRDKMTQVLWGIRDFEERFGRRPEGMWLPETAVDGETLDVLAETGIRFTVLSPFQAARWRFEKGGSPWHDVSGGSIPTGRAYRYRCKGGKSLFLFFYDASLAKGIAFERLLGDSGHLLSRIQSCHDHRDPTVEEPWLVHTATDGESYGHHFKFGDMALAAAFEQMSRDVTSEVVNYAAFLDSFPVLAQVEIHENTAWSCVHGLGRWTEDCGCHIGGGESWSQKWRTPLREAMNHLREKLAHHFEERMSLLTRDPWAVRDAYVHVLIDRDPRAVEFAHDHLKSPVPENVARFYQLLEMERNAMFMFTSCGWFFDDVSGLETILVLRFAARAIQLAEKTGSPCLEPGFLEILAKAPSNVPRYGNGAEVYLKEVRPSVIDTERVVANYAIHALAMAAQRQYSIFCHDIVPLDEEDLGHIPAPSLYGRLLVKDRRTRSEEQLLYAVIHFEGLDFRCSVNTLDDDGKYESTLKALQQSAEEQSTVKMVRVMDETFGPAFYTLHDVFRDLRSSLALEISRKKLSMYSDLQRNAYQLFRPLMASLRQWSVRIPSDLRLAARRVLSDQVRDLVDEMLLQEVSPGGESLEEPENWDESSFFYRAHMGKLASLQADAESWGVTLEVSRIATGLGKAMVETLTMLEETLSLRHAARFYRLIRISRQLKLRAEVWKLQTLYYQLLKAARKNSEAIGGIPNFGGFLVELDDYLDCRFSETFGGLAISAPKAVVPGDKHSRITRGTH